MCRNLTPLISVVMFLAMACSAQAATYNWTNDGDGNSWCNRFNWDPNTSVPGPLDTARLRNPQRGPVVDCDAAVALIDGPANNQVVDVISGTLSTVGDWDCQEGSATINITGTSVVEIGGSWPQKNGTLIINVSGNPTITVGGTMKTANDEGDTFELYMSGGSFDITGKLSWGEDGGGVLSVSGGASLECGELFYEGRGGDPWTLNLNGGTITVNGPFTAPDDPSGAGLVTINLDAGTLDCNSFDHPGGAYAMDINEGVFMVGGNRVAAMTADVTAGYITAFNDTVDVSVTYDDVLKKTIVRADYVIVKATDPTPDDYAWNQCPGVELKWQPGEYAVDHNVYFGNSLSDVNESADPCLDHYASTQWTPSGLKLGTTYYWRVDGVDDSCDASPWVGDIWRFTTNDGNALDPYPADKETAVPIDANLHWTPGCTADSHDVYFGTDYNDVRDANNSWPVGTSVYKGNQVVAANEYDPCDFDYFTYYYWRIDEVDNGTIYKGTVWSFRSGSVIPDPELILWYELDETQGSIVSDSSGYEHHGSGYRIDGQWEPNNGHIKGCLDFDADQHVAVPSDTLETINKEVTVAVWVKGDDDHADEEGRIFDTGAGDYYMRARIPTDEGYLLWRAGNGPNDSLVWRQASPLAWAEEWHHFAFVKDENADTMIIYFDGFEAESKSGTIDSLFYVKNNAFRIGADNDQMSDYTGKLDDFRIYNTALSPTEIAGLFRGGDVGLAWAPSPYNGEIDVPYDVNLSWMQGDYVNDVNGHDVYIGTNYDDVNDVNRSNLASYPNVDYYNVSDTNCDPGLLTVDQIYYWRVDEVNDPCTWKGEVWRFTVAEFLIIDDMEDYTEGSEYPIAWTSQPYGWNSAYNNGTGSFLALGLLPTYPASDEKLMVYIYDNTGDYGSGYLYSEISNNFTLDPCDWTILDMKMLTLWFYGDPLNSSTGIEQMYVGVEDSTGSGSYSEVRYGDGDGEDVNDIAIAQWQRWNIPLASFTNADLESLEKLYIGFGQRGNLAVGGTGTVYFDDIRLYPASCVPSMSKPELDWDNDCTVGWGEVEIMAGQWLKSDVNVAPVVEPDPCVLHYEFDETTGSLINDSSGNGYNATAKLEDGTPTDAFWEPNGMYDRCIRFEHRQKAYCVAVPNDVFDNHITNQIAISVWVNWDDPATMPDERNQLFSISGGPGADYNDILGIETSWVDDSEIIFWDANNSVTYKVGQGDWSGGWNHYVFVKDVNVLPGSLKIYHNGQLVEEDDSNAPMTFPADNAWIGIATDSPNDVHDNYQGNWHDQYTGLLDDFRIYDYALSEPEIGYLASSGTGIVTVQSVANLVNDEPPGNRAVNFKDFDKLADAWLEQKLWPE